MGKASCWDFGLRCTHCLGICLVPSLPTNSMAPQGSRAAFAATMPGQLISTPPNCSNWVDWDAREVAEKGDVQTVSPQDRKDTCPFSVQHFLARVN